MNAYPILVAASQFLSSRFKTRVALLIALIALIAIPLFSSSLASSTGGQSNAKVVPERALSNKTAPSFADLFGKQLSAVHHKRILHLTPALVESISTFAADCTTPKTAFQLGETVCAQTDGVDLQGDRHVNWINPDLIVVHGGDGVTDITTNPQNFTFTLPTGSSSIGTWKVSIATPSDISETPAIFTVSPAPESIAIYRSDCTTPASEFDLGETVCAKIFSPPLGAFAKRRLALVNSTNFILASDDVTTDGQTLSFTLPSTATSNLGGIIVDNRGSWSGVGAATNDGSVRVATPFIVKDPAQAVANLAIYKTVSGNEQIAPGGFVTFNLTVTNLGPEAAANVEFTDDVPANATFVSETQDSGPTFTCMNPTSGGTGTTSCTITGLAREAEATFTLIYQVGNTVPAGTIILNTADITSTTTERHAADNSTEARALVTVGGAGGCTLDCPANVVVTADTTSGGQSGAFVTLSAAAVFGDCGAVTNSPPSGSFFAVGTHTVTSSSELGGASCNFTVTVLDTNPPTITCPANIIVTAPSGATEVTVNTGSPTFNASGGGTVTFVRSDDQPAVYDDQGNVVTPAVIHSLTDPFPLGSTGINWTVTDAGGRTASCTQIITVLVNNRQPVTISCPAHVTVTAAAGDCASGATTIPASTIGTPTTNPNDSDVSVVASRSDGLPLTDPFPIGTTQITWTATDDQNGSVASCVQNVTVNPASGNDTTPPSLVVPPNVTATTSSCTATLDDELGVATATDTCPGTVTITRTGVPANFVFPTGTTTITYTATDAAGNSTTGTQLVTVTESPAVPPTITAPADVTAFTGPGATSCGTVVSDATLGTAAANDNCPGVTVTRTGVPAGNIFPVGNTTVTYTATDKSGNIATDTQLVTVIDNTVPVVTAPAPVTLFTGPGATACGVTVTNLDATLGTGSATDNCPGVGPVTRGGVPAGNAFPVGQTTLSYSATDAHGNTSSANQVVTVIDNTLPAISCPASIIADFDAAVNGAVVTYVAPVGTDNCPSTTTQIAGLPSGSTFPVGNTTNTFRVTDASGNTAECSFSVTVALTSIIGLDSVTLSGSALVDSYDSAGGYPATKGSLANILSNGTVTISGSSKLFGNVRSTRVGVSVLGASQVTGNATAGTTVTKGPSAVIGGTITNNLLAPVMTLPSVAACGPPYSPNSGISGTYSYNPSTGNLTISGINNATLANGTYCFNNVTLTNSGQLRVNGPVTIKLTGTLSTSGATSITNTTAVPGNLRILSSFSGSNGVTFGNSTSVHLLLYAPNTNVTDSGSAPLFGTIVGKTVTISNSGQVHYDIKLKTVWPDLWSLILGP